MVMLTTELSKIVKSAISSPQRCLKNFKQFDKIQQNPEKLSKITLHVGLWATPSSYGSTVLKKCSERFKTHTAIPSPLLSQMEKTFGEVAATLHQTVFSGLFTAENVRCSSQAIVPLSQSQCSNLMRPLWTTNQDCSFLSYLTL